jgi:hypothetical protein
MDINKKINSSIGLLEKFESNIEILRECFESISITLPQDIKVVAQNTIEELKQLIAIFEDSFNPLELSDQINLSGNIFKSKVYSLGIGLDLFYDATQALLYNEKLLYSQIKESNK